MKSVLTPFLAVCWSLPLVSCNEEEVNALTEQKEALQKEVAVHQEQNDKLQSEKDDLNDKLTEATVKGSKLETLLAEKSAEAKDLAAKLNTANTDLAVARKEIETIREVREELLAKQAADKRDQDINQWNDGIDQIGGIADIMIAYKGKDIHIVLRTRGYQAGLEEVDNKKRYLNERKAEADALAYKLPPSKDRKALLTTIEKLNTALASKHFWDCSRWFNGRMHGLDSPEFKKQDEHFGAVRTKALDARSAIADLKRKEVLPLQ